MMTFEQKLTKYIEEGKIVFYDYLQYKKAAGWKNTVPGDNWERPLIVKPAFYNASFLHNLKDKYYLGLPIKEILKSTYSKKRSSLAVLALSLYFPKFIIVNFEASSCFDYFKEHFNFKTEDCINHTVLLVDLDGTKAIIDTTLGIITDLSIYEDLFKLTLSSTITSDALKETDTYTYLKKYANDDYKKFSDYESILDEFMFICETEANIMSKKPLTNDDLNLRKFLSEQVLTQSNKGSMIALNNALKNFFLGNGRYQYPDKNMYSLTDDNDDTCLYNIYDDSKKQDMVKVISSVVSKFKNRKVRKLTDTEGNKKA